MKKLLILSTAVFLFTGLGFAQTGAGAGAGKGKAKDSTSKKAMPKSCPGKTCGKKKG